jgi:hypothetical protein
MPTDPKKDTIPLTDLLECAQREVAMREAVYPKRVANGKMTLKSAQHEIACMERIVDLLDWLVKRRATYENTKPKQL